MFPHPHSTGLALNQAKVVAFSSPAPGCTWGAMTVFLAVLLLFPFSSSCLAQPGVLDDSPMGFPDNSVAASLRQPDGKILFAGGFLAHDGFTTRRVARLNVDGSTDTSFVARVGNDHVDPADSPQVSALAIQPTDNHILVGGTFTQVWNTQAVRLARLTPGGSHDTSFVAEANGRVNAIAV